MGLKEVMPNGQRQIILHGTTKRVYRRSGEVVNYKFNEDETIKQIQRYVDNTYDQHYAYGEYQATDVIFDNGHGEGFCMGNVIKYAMRYGKKNGKDFNDLMKIIHYAIITLEINHKSKTNKGLFNDNR